MGEIALGHEVVGINNTLDVGPMDAYSDAHKQVLRPLGRDAIDLQQVRPFEGFETKAEESLITARTIEEKAYKL